MARHLALFPLSFDAEGTVDQWAAHSAELDDDAVSERGEPLKRFLATAVITLMMIEELTVIPDTAERRKKFAVEVGVLTQSANYVALIDQNSRTAVFVPAYFIDPQTVINDCAKAGISFERDDDYLMRFAHVYRGLNVCDLLQDLLKLRQSL